MSQHTIEIAKLIVSIVGLVGTLLVGLLALRSYLRGEKWKRAEFLAKEMKEFFDDTRVEKALLLIDWGQRTVALLDKDAVDQGRVHVTRQTQIRALLPHTLSSVTRSDSEDTGGDSSMAQARYTPAEAAIRDCYDALLDGLERFSSYLKTGLISVDQLRPYIQYWVDDIHGPTDIEEDAAWSAAFLTYIAFYEFHGVQWLFEAFDRSIDPGGSAYQDFSRRWITRTLHESLSWRRKPQSSTR